MDGWCADFDNWALCDTVCFSLFDRAPDAWSRLEPWARDDREFVRRASFALLWSLALHDKSANDALFVGGLALVEQYAADERPLVTKSMSMSLRATRDATPPYRAPYAQPPRGWPRRTADRHGASGALPSGRCPDPAAPGATVPGRHRLPATCSEARLMTKALDARAAPVRRGDDTTAGSRPASGSSRSGISSPRPTSGSAPRRGEVADYIPALAVAIAERFGTSVVGGRGRPSRPATSPRRSRSRASRSRSSSPWCASPSATARPAPTRGEQHGVSVRLGDGGGVQRPRRTNPGQCRRHGHHQPHPGSDGRGQVGAHRGRVVGLRRPRASVNEEVYESESATNAQQGIAHLLESYGRL